MLSYTQVQLRRDTANQWYISNPILLSGEVGVETDTNRFKIGDGLTQWNNLTYSFKPVYDNYSIQFVRPDPTTVFNESNNTININYVATGLPSAISTTFYLFANNTFVSKTSTIVSNGASASAISLSTRSLVNGTNYRIDAVNDDSVVIGSITLMYMKRYNIDVSFEFTSSTTANITITNNSDTGVSFSGSTLKALVRDDVTNNFNAILEVLLPTTISIAARATYRTTCTLTGDRIFQNNKYYLFEYLFDTTFQYQSRSPLIQFTTQKVTSARFDPDENGNLFVDVSDGTCKFTSIEVTRSRTPPGRAPIETIFSINPDTGSSSISAGRKTLNLSSDLPVNRDIYTIRGKYANGSYLIPVLPDYLGVVNFIQQLTIADINITGQNSFTTSFLNIDGSDYNVSIEVKKPDNTTLYTSPPISIRTIGSEAVQINSTETDTYTVYRDVEKRSADNLSRDTKPFYGIAFTAYNMNARWHTKDNIRDCLLEGLKYSYRFRIYGLSDSQLYPYDTKIVTDFGYMANFGKTYNQIFDRNLDVDSPGDLPNQDMNGNTVSGRTISWPSLGGPNRTCITLHRILDIIKNAPAESELKKIQLYYGISISRDSGFRTWVPNLESMFTSGKTEITTGSGASAKTTKVTNERGRVEDFFYVIEKYGTDNICGISLGNEVILNYKQLKYSKQAQFSLLNRYYCVFKYMRQRFAYYYYRRQNGNSTLSALSRIDGKTTSDVGQTWTSLGHARYTNTPIQYVPLGITDALGSFNPLRFHPLVDEGGDASDTGGFELNYLVSLIRMCDFVGLNAHPLYGGISRALNLDQQIDSWYNAILNQFNSVKRYLQKIVPDIRVFVGESGMPALASPPNTYRPYSTSILTSAYSFFPQVGSNPDTIRISYISDDVRQPISDLLTTETQLKWAIKLASRNGANAYDGMDFYYFSLYDNYAQVAFPSGKNGRTTLDVKGNYVASWGLYTFDRSIYHILTMPGQSTTFNLNAINLVANKSKYYDVNNNQITPDTLLTSFAYNTFADQNRDFSFYGSEYPDLYAISPDQAFSYAQPYKFSYKAGGQTTNILPAPEDPVYTQQLIGDLSINRIVFSSSRSLSVKYTYRSTSNYVARAGTSLTWYIDEYNSSRTLITSYANTVTTFDCSRSTETTVNGETTINYDDASKDLQLPSGSTFTVGNLYKIRIVGEISYSDEKYTQYSPIQFLNFNSGVSENRIQIQTTYLDNYNRVSVQAYYIDNTNAEVILGTQNPLVAFLPDNPEQGVATTSLDFIFAAGVSLMDYYGTTFFLRGTFTSSGNPNLPAITIRSADIRIEYPTSTRYSNLQIRYDKRSFSSSYPPPESIAPGFDISSDDTTYQSRLLQNIYLTKLINGSYIRIANYYPYRLVDAVRNNQPISSVVTFEYMSGYSLNSLTPSDTYAILWTINPRLGTFANQQIKIQDETYQTYVFPDYNDNISTRTLTITGLRDFLININLRDVTLARSIKYSIKEVGASGQVNTATDRSLISDTLPRPTSLVTRYTRSIKAPSSVADTTKNFIIGKSYYLDFYQEISDTDDSQVRVSTSPINVPIPTRCDYTISFTSPTTDTVDGNIYYRITNFVSDIPALRMKVRVFNVASTTNFIDSPEFSSIDIDNINWASITPSYPATSLSLTRNSNYKACILYYDNTTRQHILANSVTYSPLYISASDVVIGNNMITFIPTFANNTDSSPPTLRRITVYPRDSTGTINYSSTVQKAESPIIIRPTTAFNRATKNYVVSVTLPSSTEDVYTKNFEYNTFSITATVSFDDPTTPNVQPDDLGNLNVRYTTDPTTSFERNSITFQLYEYDSLSDADGIVVNTITGRPFGQDNQFAFNSRSLSYGKYYQIRYSLSQPAYSNLTGVFPSSKIQYLAQGFDIIVLAGGDNMVGLDRDQTLITSSYTARNERGGFPHLTDTEINNIIVDKNGNHVKIYNYNNTQDNSSTIYKTATQPFTFNLNKPYLRALTGNMKNYRPTSIPKDIDSNLYPLHFNQPDGISCGYQFIKYYANNISIPANRRLCVVNAAVPLSKFQAGAGYSNVWNSGARLSANIKNALQNISKSRTLGAIDYDVRYIRYKNRNKTLKYGCEVSPSNLEYTQQIVNNFDFGYLIDDINVSSIHPNNNQNITGDNPGSGYTNDTNFRTMLQNELVYLRTGTRPSGYTNFKYLKGSDTLSDYNSDYLLESKIRPIAEFLRDNDMKLRINGLLSFDDDTLRTRSTYWLNQSGSKYNRICALMRHCYYVVSWFETNYPGLVIGYDVIRNYSRMIDIQVDGRGSLPTKNGVASGCMDFSNTVTYNGNTTPATTNKILDKNDTIFIEACYIAVYAACKSRFDSNDIQISWTDVDFNYFESNIKSRLTNALDYATGKLTQFANTYGRNADGTSRFPINYISFQCRYLSGHFLTGANNTYNQDRGEYDDTITGLLFSSTSGVRGSLGDLISKVNDIKLKVTFTEFQVGMNDFIPGGGNSPFIDDMNTYWGSSNNYRSFRTFQDNYFLRNMYNYINRSSSSNIDKEYLGFGSLVSNRITRLPIKNQLTSFFFESDTGSGNLTETRDNNNNTLINSFIDRIGGEATPAYTSHRVVAFLWGGGPTQYSSTTYTNDITLLLNDIYTTCSYCITQSVIVPLICNFESGFVTRDAAVNSITWNELTSNYTILEDIDNYSSGSYPNLESINTIGLHSIDPNSPDNIEVVNKYMFTGCFSARSQRLLGLRMFNAYLDKLKLTNLPLYRNIESPTLGVLTRALKYTFDTSSGNINTLVRYSSYSSSKNPIGLLVTCSYQQKSGTRLQGSSGLNIRTAFMTEYSIQYKPSIVSSASSLTFIPYNSFSPYSSWVAGNSFNSFLISGTSYNITNLLYSTDSYDTVTDDIITTSNNIIPKRLTTSIRRFLDSIKTKPAEIESSNYQGISLYVQAVYRENSNNKIDTELSYLAPISLYIWGQTQVGNGKYLAANSTATYVKINSTNFSGLTLVEPVVSGKSNYITMNNVIKCATLVGYEWLRPYDALPSDYSSLNIAKTANVVRLGSKLAGSSVYTNTFTSDIEEVQFGSTAVDNLSRSFTISGTICYASKDGYTQAAGVSASNTISNNIDPTIPVGSGIIDRQNLPFFFIRNADTYIQFALQNTLPNRTYTVSYSFAVQRGRVPYAGTAVSSKNVVINSDTYNFFILDPFPITVSYKTLANDTTTLIATQNLNFRLPVTNDLNSNPVATAANPSSTIYVHKNEGSDGWDGFWKDISFTFTTPAAPQCRLYLKIGPLPARSYIDTIFMFRDFSFSN